MRGLRRPIGLIATLIVLALMVGTGFYLSRSAVSPVRDATAEQAERGVAVPALLDISAGGTHYAVPATAIRRIQLATESIKAGYEIDRGRLVKHEQVADDCGSSSNIAPHGARYVVFFNAGTGPRRYWEVALAADRIDAPPDAGRAAYEWDPAKMPVPHVKSMMLCFTFNIPKAAHLRYGGGTAICDRDGHAPGSCYAQWRDDEALWMIEFPAASRSDIPLFLEALHHLVDPMRFRDSAGAVSRRWPVIDRPTVAIRPDPSWPTDDVDQPQH